MLKVAAASSLANFRRTRDFLWCLFYCFSVSVVSVTLPECKDYKTKVQLLQYGLIFGSIL